MWELSGMAKALQWWWTTGLWKRTTAFLPKKSSQKPFYTTTPATFPHAIAMFHHRRKNAVQDRDHGYLLSWLRACWRYKRGVKEMQITPPDWRPESTLASPLTADALIQTGHDCCWSGRVEGVTNREWTMSSIVPDDSDTESWIWISIIQERDVWMSLSMWRVARQCIGNFIRNCNLICWLNQFVQTIFDLCRWKLCEWIKSNM